VEGYIRSAASKRGIDPEVAIRVAQSEGGLVPNRTGSFKTGKSFWPYQLHYGGPGYEQFGNVAGMGNTFTAQTGYQPGDPNAWQAATDYALDAAAKNGWGAWYGARNQGITGYQGINRSGAPTAAPAPARSGAAPAGEAPPWVQDLLSSGYGGTPGAADLVDRGPVVPNAVQTGVDAMRAGEQVDPNAPPWVRELLSSGAGATGSPGSPSRSAPPRAGAGYDGPPQTDEVWPVAGHKWGQVNNPFGGVQSRSAGATVALPSRNVGADLTAGYGEEVVAPVSGTVVDAFDAPNETDRNLNHGWGGSVVLQGDNGFTYRLSHLQPGLRVRPGMRVARGQQVGAVGVSGNTTGPHLDAEKFSAPGKFVDIVAGGRSARADGRAGEAPAPGAGGNRSVGYGGDTSGLPPWVRDALS
jgi:murein DD-endopeptidase MepM/ murein hydrolase activator NlpD